MMGEAQSASRGVFAIVKQGLVIAWKTIGKLLPIYIVCIAIGAGITWWNVAHGAVSIQGSSHGSESAGVLLLNLLDRLVLLWMITAAMWGAVAQADGRSWSTAGAAWAGLKRAIPVLLAALLVSLCVGIGFLLLIVPGIYLSVRLYPVIYLVAGERLGPIEGFDKGAGLVKGNWWHTAGVMVVGLVITMIVWVPALVGLVSLFPGLFPHGHVASSVSAAPRDFALYMTLLFVICLVVWQINLGLHAAIIDGLRRRETAADDGSSAMTA